MTKTAPAATPAPDDDPTPRERVELAIGPNKTGHDDMACEAHVADEPREAQAAPTEPEAN